MVQNDKSEVTNGNQVKAKKGDNTEESGWLSEQISDGFKLSYERVPAGETSFHPAKGTSDFQTYEVFETTAFGRVLLVDGLLQCSQFDEYVYHESLVHPALVAHGCPSNVMVLGGGEGCTLREVLKNPHVTSATMVDIDKPVVEACAELCPMFSDGAYQDPRSHLIFADAKEVVETCSDGSLDVLICDLNDPLEGGPCWKLYSQEFYLTAYRKLAPGGVLVTQAGCSSVWLHTEEDSQYSAICNTLKTVFGPDQVLPYGAFLPSFTDEWGFMLCFKNARVPSDLRDCVMGINVDEELSALGLGGDALTWYDSVAHRKMFAVPKPVRKLLESDKTVISLANPYYLSSYLEQKQVMPTGIDTIGGRDKKKKQQQLQAVDGKPLTGKAAATATATATATAMKV